MNLARRLAQWILVDLPLKRANKFHSIDPSCILGLRFRIDHSVLPEKREYVKTGRNCVLNCRITFESTEGKVVIGDNSNIGNSMIICRSAVTIGSNVTMAWGITIYDHNSHSIDWHQRRIDHQRIYEDTMNGFPLLNKDWSTVNTAPIVVEDDAWIGMNAIILKGVTVGRASIVGAGSVVTKDVPPFCIVAGNPAKVVKRIDVMNK